MFLQQCNEESRVIPITGFTSEIQVLIFGVIFPLIFSIIVAIIFARYIAPLFLKAKKNILARDYTDGYITRKANFFKGKTMIKRLIYVILLTFGFLSFLIPAVDVNQWLSPETLCSYKERGLDPQYHFTLFLTLMGLVYPLSIGFWAVAWAIEDSGLMHYTFQSDEYYEIEPVHIVYSSYLKGYAGISSLLFVIQFVLYQVENNSPADGAIILAALIIAVICFFPAYVLSIKIMGSHSYLKKNLQEIKKLTEADLK